ncbi:hypothetical protein HK097_006465, partial [Rhizophlyctis rosea]
NNDVDPRITPKRSFNIIYGSRFTGKTVLLAHFIKEFHLPKKAFPGGILILSPSLHDKSWASIRDRKSVTILGKCNNDLLFDLIDAQEKALKTGNCKHILLVIDDFATQGRGLKALEELATRGRHLKVTCIITAQYSKLLPPTVRHNANGVIMFKMSDSEIDSLGKEGLRCLVDLDDFVHWVKRHTAEPRSF